MAVDIKDFKNAVGFLANATEQAINIDRDNDGEIEMMEIIRALGSVGISYTTSPLKLQQVREQWEIIRLDNTLREEVLEHFEQELDIKGKKRIELTIEKIVEMAEYNYGAILTLKSYWNRD